MTTSQTCRLAALHNSAALQPMRVLWSTRQILVLVKVSERNRALLLLLTPKNVNYVMSYSPLCHSKPVWLSSRLSWLRFESIQTRFISWFIKKIPFKGMICLIGYCCFYFLCPIEESKVWKNMRVRKWWQKIHFQVNYSYKNTFCDSLLSWYTTTQMKYGQMEGVRKMDEAELYYWFLVDGIPSWLILLSLTSLVQTLETTSHGSLHHSAHLPSFLSSLHLSSPYFPHHYFWIYSVFSWLVLALPLSVSVQASCRETPSSLEVRLPVALLRVTGLMSF